MTVDEIEVKNVVDELLKRFKVALGLDQLRVAIHGVLQKRYNRGLEEVDSILSPPQNVLPNEAAISFVSKYAFDNIKDMNDDLASRLRKELTEALLNQESAASIKKRLISALDISKARAATIARTESHRAYNMGKLEAAKQSGLKLKKTWTNPDPQSEVCRALSGHSVSVDGKFKWHGEEFFAPPAHPNCRSTLVFEQVGE